MQSCCWLVSLLLSPSVLQSHWQLKDTLSLSCHYQQTSHGCGVALQRQKRGVGLLLDWSFFKRKKGLGTKQRDKQKYVQETVFPAFLLVIKGFGGLLRGNSCQMSSRTFFLAALSKCTCCIQITHVGCQIYSCESTVSSRLGWLYFLWGQYCVLFAALNYFPMFYKEVLPHYHENCHVQKADY